MKIIRPIYNFLKGVILISALMLITINLVVYIVTKPYIYNKTSVPVTVQAAIIPGASVISNRILSPILKDRVDSAIQLYNSKKVSKILVSGDNSTVDYNEVDTVRLYLLEKGVLDKDIFLDHAGFDTYSAMYRARDIFKVDSVFIVTQSFHLPRSVFIARQLGIDAYGVRADGGHILSKNYIREFFANGKAVFNLLLNTKPQYLGEEIPITGDGRNSP